MFSSLTLYKTRRFTDIVVNKTLYDSTAPYQIWRMKRYAKSQSVTLEQSWTNPQNWRFLPFAALPSQAPARPFQFPYRARPTHNQNSKTPARGGGGAGAD